MNEMTSMVEDTAARLFTQAFPFPAIHALESGSYDDDLWNVFERTEFGSLLAHAIHVEAGPGADASTAADAADAAEAALALLYAAGSLRVPLPIAETLVAHAVAAGAGIEAGKGIATCVQGSLQATALEDGEWQLTGEARRVPWARHAEWLLVCIDIAGLPLAGWLRTGAPGVRILSGHNVANEPRDDVHLEGARMRLHAASGPSPALLRALCTAALIAGAAEAALELTVSYAMERRQFGKPIYDFQAVQQQIAVLAGEVASVRAACALAFANPAGGDWRRVAVAKVRAGVAASMAAEVAHQVHGAIGVTWEYPLQLLTRRLWSWRAENGADAVWAEKLGREVIARGGARLWPDLVALQPKTAAA